MGKKLNSLIVFILSVLGGMAYRMGGSGNFPRYFRELGQGLCVAIDMPVLGLITLTWQAILGDVLAFGICWAESTYFKKKGTDAKWYNWALVGLVFAVVPLPYCILTNSHWIGFGVRAVLCPVLVVLWQEKLSAQVAEDFKIGKDITDEFGRGFINVATLPLLLI